MTDTELVNILFGIALGVLIDSLLVIHGKRSFHKIVYENNEATRFWPRLTATLYLYGAGYGWRESWIRMKYPPNYI